MARTYWSAGLDQLGPKHVHARMLFPQRERIEYKPQRINTRAATSTRNRRVKITLPCLKILETMR